MIRRFATRLEFLPEAPRQRRQLRVLERDRGRDRHPEQAGGVVDHDLGRRRQVVGDVVGAAGVRPGERGGEHGGDVGDVDAAEHLAGLDHPLRPPCAQAVEHAAPRPVDPGQPEVVHGQPGRRPGGLGRHPAAAALSRRLERVLLADPAAAPVAVDARGREVAGPLRPRPRQRVGMAREHRVAVGGGRQRREQRVGGGDRPVHGRAVGPVDRLHPGGPHRCGLLRRARGPDHPPSDEACRQRRRRVAMPERYQRPHRPSREPPSMRRLLLLAALAPLPAAAEIRSAEECAAAVAADPAMAREEAALWARTGGGVAGPPLRGRRPRRARRPRLRRAAADPRRRKPEPRHVGAAPGRRLRGRRRPVARRRPVRPRRRGPRPRRRHHRAGRAPPAAARPGRRRRGRLAGGEGRARPRRRRRSARTRSRTPCSPPRCAAWATPGPRPPRPRRRCASPPTCPRRCSRPAPRPPRPATPPAPGGSGCG